MGPKSFTWDASWTKGQKKAAKKSQKPWVLCECGKGWMFCHKIKPQSHCNRCGAYYMAQAAWAGSQPIDASKHMEVTERSKFLQQIAKYQEEGKVEIVDALKKLHPAWVPAESKPDLLGRHTAASQKAIGAQRRAEKAVEKAALLAVSLEEARVHAAKCLDEQRLAEVEARKEREAY